MATPTISLLCAFTTVLLISMAFLPPFIQASRPRGTQGEQMVANTQGDSKKFSGVYHHLLDRFHSSERQVPSGPDPLHHHLSPFQPLLP